jgi:hypothetical protein
MKANNYFTARVKGGRVTYIPFNDTNFNSRTSAITEVRRLLELKLAAIEHVALYRPMHTLVQMTPHIIGLDVCIRCVPDAILNGMRLKCAVCRKTEPVLAETARNRSRQAELFNETHTPCQEVS